MKRSNIHLLPLCGLSIGFQLFVTSCAHLPEDHALLCETHQCPMLTKVVPVEYQSEEYFSADMRLFQKASILLFPNYDRETLVLKDMSAFAAPGGPPPIKQEIVHVCHKCTEALNGFLWIVYEMKSTSGTSIPQALGGGEKRRGQVPSSPFEPQLPPGTGNGKVNGSDEGSD